MYPAFLHQLHSNSISPRTFGYNDEVYNHKWGKECSIFKFPRRKGKNVSHSTVNSEAFVVFVKIFCNEKLAFFKVGFIFEEGKLLHIIAGELAR